MTGDPISTKRLADSVGFRFAKRGDDYVHAGAVMVLSPAGQVTRYLYGVTFLPFDVKMAVTEASQGRTGPTIARFLKFCYSYDPTGRRYFLDITRVAAAFTVMLAVGFGIAVAVQRKKRPRSPKSSPKRSLREYRRRIHRSPSRQRAQLLRRILAPGNPFVAAHHRPQAHRASLSRRHADLLPGGHDHRRVHAPRAPDHGPDHHEAHHLQRPVHSCTA
jgi:hypothetical protein